MVCRYLMCLFLFVIISCGGDKTVENEPTIGEEGLLEGVSPVTKESDYYGVGFTIGKPVKVSQRGWIWKTNEAQINVGAFGDNYIGHIQLVSIEDDGLASQFEQLDQTQLYVFKYEYPHALNPEIEDTHYHIRSWEPFSPQNVQLSYRGVSSYLEKKGPYSSGTRQGRVIEVERWGYWDIDCSVTIKVGGMGLRDAGLGRGSEAGADASGKENSVYMNTYSEESCDFAEQVLKAGVDVEFEYSEDYVEIWDLTSRVLHKITVL
ncbi:MAG: hypothetical protein OXK80_01455 [Bdellovibrionales bacterium]|nr:hypothetical protein [Bdellovibrionales bacterium]